MTYTTNQEILVHHPPSPSPQLAAKYYFPVTKIAKGNFLSLQLMSLNLKNCSPKGEICSE